jgi:putative pyruvate formate lyase activating enzyme
MRIARSTGAPIWHSAVGDFVSDERPEASYVALHRSGELARRAADALAELADCRVCPRDCRVDRLHAVAAPDVAARRLAGNATVERAPVRTVASHIPKGISCFTGRYARVSSAFAHFGEEDCLRGWNGSGTIFFSFCNLRCAFCQNWDVSQVGEGVELRAEALASLMLQLQSRGCHNINFVTPEHVVPQILEALALAADGGLQLPLVYNTSAYDSLRSLELLDGVVDVYMPDFKYWDAELARRYLKAADYPRVAGSVVREMHRQVGPLRFDRSGLAVRGVLVRHLVMPAASDDARAVFRFLAREVSPDTYVNIMAQYYPAGSVADGKYPELGRRTNAAEVAAAVAAARAEGLWRLDTRS